MSSVIPIALPSHSLSAYAAGELKRKENHGEANALLVCSSLLLLAEAVGHAVLAGFAAVANFFTCFHYPSLQCLQDAQGYLARLSWSLAKDCLFSLFSDQALQRLLTQVSPQASSASSSPTAAPSATRVNVVLHSQTGVTAATAPAPVSPAAAATAHPNEYQIRRDAGDIALRLAKEQGQALRQQLEAGDNFPFMYDFFEPESGDLPGLTVENQRVGRFSVGISHFQGMFRQTMEDEHLTTEFNLQIGNRVYPVQLFGIFDGHGGVHAAQYVRDHLSETLAATLREFNPERLAIRDIWNALKLTFVRLNDDYERDFGNISSDYADGTKMIAHREGTTATVAMVLDGKLWMASLGDSRAVLDTEGRALQLTQDAKPNIARYRRGVEKRGGDVALHEPYRVNGVLAIARSIGDHQLRDPENKHWVISARPKITMTHLAELAPGFQLILACDGVWDVASSGQVAHGAAGARSHQLRTAEAIAGDIVYSAAMAGSRDNISALVIRDII